MLTKVRVERKVDDRVLFEVVEVPGEIVVAVHQGHFVEDGAADERGDGLAGFWEGVDEEEGGEEEWEEKKFEIWRGEFID